MARELLSNDLPTHELLSRARAGDRAAVDALCRRERERLEALVRTRLGAYLRQAIDLEDVVQETFVRAIAAIRSYEDSGPDSFFRWLGGIANHVLHEAARRQKRDLIVPLYVEPPSQETSAEKRGMREEQFLPYAAMGETFSRTARACSFRARGARRPPGAEEGEVAARRPVWGRSSSPTRKDNQSRSLSAVDRSGRPIRGRAEYHRLREALDSLSEEHRRVIVLARLQRMPLREVAKEMGRTTDAATQLLWRALRKLKEAFGATDSLHLPDLSIDPDKDTSDHRPQP